MNHAVNKVLVAITGKFQALTRRKSMDKKTLELIAALKEARDVTAALFRCFAQRNPVDPQLSASWDAFAAELDYLGIKQGFGKRWQDLISSAAAGR